MLRPKLYLFSILIGVLYLNGQSYVNYPQDGIYGGLETGVARVFVKGGFVIDKQFEFKEYINKDYTKAVISINLGYGKYIDESFVGIETHYSFYPKKISDYYTQNDYDFGISISSKSEMDLIIGRKIGSRSLLTLRGGIAFSNIEVVADNNLNGELYILDKKWFGLSVGMGYVYGINDKLSIKSKYNLTAFKNNEYPKTKTELVDNRFTLSLIYRIWSQN